MSNPEFREPASSPCQAPPGHWDEEAPTQPAAVTLTLLVLKTRQVAGVRAFYQALGIAFVEERHGDGPAHVAGVVGGLTLEVYPLPDGPEAADRTLRLGFSVADLGRVLDALQAAGTPVLNPPEQTTWGRRAVVRDPDGRAVELYQR